MPSIQLRKSSTARCRIKPMHVAFTLFLMAVALLVYNLFGFKLMAIDQWEEIAGSYSDTHSRISYRHGHDVTQNQLNIRDERENLRNETIPRQKNSKIRPFELPVGLQLMLRRAKEMKKQCDTMPLVQYEPNAIDLSAFGIIQALESYLPESEQEATDWQCVLPPERECDTGRFTVIFLGYSTDRLNGMKLQIRTMLGSLPYSDMVEEVVLVWNNPLPLNMSGSDGEFMYQWSLRQSSPFVESEPNRFRIFFPLEHGLPSSLMNRYHPMIQPKSKALLYYDDDGPFYHERAIRSNFELWKRNSNVQTGAMARAFTLSSRQQHEKEELLGGPDNLDDRKFVSHCRDNGDKVQYDFRFFENFHANMVLPSGSMIHRNYLCFVWHPALKELRKFVHEHIVHPDDMTVSTIVSQLSGRAPMTYSRRLPEQRRRLQEVVNGTSPLGMWRTKDWGSLRSIALNSVLSYFGAINSGSYGWCYKTRYHERKGKRHVCEPEMARVGMLPWMERGGYGNDICLS